MNRRFFSTLSCLLLLVLVLMVSGCSQGNNKNGDAGEKASNEMEPIVLKFAHFFPATHPVETQLVQVWGKEVEKATNGMVKVKSYPGETLLKATETYDGVVNGVADAGLSFFSYNRGRFPMEEVIELPGISYNNAKVVSKVGQDYIKEFNPKGIQDTKLITVASTGPAYLATKSPITKLEELKGVQFRTTGLSAEAIKAIGGVPVAMPMSDAYEALSKGVVSGIISPPEALEGYKLAEVTGNITKTPFVYACLFYMTMNRDVWDSLPAEAQTAIEGVNEKFADVAANLFDGLNAHAMKFAEENGAKIHSLTPEETDRWVTELEKFQQKLVDEKVKNGLPADDAITRIKELAAKYNEMYK